MLRSHVNPLEVVELDLDETWVRAALANGAREYLSQGLPAALLVSTPHDIHHGEGQVFHGPSGNPKTSIGDWPGREEGLEHGFFPDHNRISSLR